MTDNRLWKSEWPSPTRSLLGLLLFACLAACQPTAADPSMVFEAGFEMPLDTVSIEGSGGFAAQGHDAWIHFTSAHRVQLKNGEHYQPVDPAPAVAFFVDQLPGKTLAAAATGTLVCLERHDPTKKHDNGAWLLFEIGSGIYYYRTWEHS